MVNSDNFNIIAVQRHRFKTDGRGITTLIGLSGCPLKCKYCINKKVLEQKNPIKTKTVELLQEIMQDYCYFVATGGGVTFGGGEPLLHYNQIKEFIDILPKYISVNIETSLNIELVALESLINYIDNWIIDIKDINPVIYKKYTGVSNDLVIDNLKYIASKKYQDKCIIRIPLIPEYNCEADRKKSIEYVKKLGFNNIDIFKYVVRN